jgi:MoaA/NifB/PqqE/SkfB family radical SAM enzyme
MKQSPVNLVFDITYRCNLQCTICDVWKISDENSRTELTSDQILKTINEFNQVFRLKNIRFLGGEPLLRKDLFEIIGKIPVSLRSEIVTNGTLITDEIAENLVKFGLDKIRFSIDGSEKYHDSIRGKGTFTKAVRGLQNINRAKIKLGSKTPKVYLCPCISRANQMHLPFLSELAQQENAQLDLIFLYDMDREELKTFFKSEEITLVRGSDPDNSVLTKEEKEIILNDVHKLYSKNKSFESGLQFKLKKKLDRLYLKYLQKRYHDCRRSLYDIIVDPWGDLFPCEFYYGYHYGSCLEGPSVWLSGRRAELRKEIRQGRLPACVLCNQEGIHRSLRYVIKNPLSLITAGRNEKLQ